jgi:hypothetical protein
MIQLTRDNISNYSEKICEHLRNLPSEERVKAAEVMERVARFTPMLVNEKERLQALTVELRSLAILPRTEANMRRFTTITTEANHVMRRGICLDLLMNKAFEDLLVFLADFSV